MKKTSHPLILMMGFVTMVCLNQSVVHAESQLMVHNNSEAKRFQEIGAITQTPGSLDPKFTSETQLSPTFIPTEKSTPWKPKSPSEYKELFDFCNRNQVDSDQWRNKLNQVTFPSDISNETQEELPGRVVIHPSCNFELQNQPRAIVLHYTEGSLDAAIATFQKPHNSSAHYIIDRDGKIYQIVPEQFAAFHVNCYGKSNFCISSCPVCTNLDGSFVEPRTQTIGIELVNLGHVDPRYYTGSSSLFEDYNNSFGYRFWEDFPQVQILSLQVLVEDIRSRWNIPLNLVMGHSRINNNVDPGPALNLFWPRYGTPQREAIFK